MLIGAEATLSLFSIGQINLTQGNRDLYLQKTRLGWVIAGGIESRNYIRNMTCQLTNLESQITKFWTIEEIMPDKSRSAEELACEDHFTKNTTRDNNGRYTVRLPFRTVDKHLGESRNVALKRLISLENLN